MLIRIVISVVVLLLVAAAAWLYVANEPRGASAVDEPPPVSDARPAKSSVASQNAADWFRDMTPECGIPFVHATGTNAEKPFPAANGSGVAACDFDLDGRCDVMFGCGTGFPIQPGSQTPTDRLYRNLGDWRFEDVSLASGLNHNGYSAGLATGDFDCDGFPDVFVNCFGASCLYRNQGDGTFQKLVETGLEDQRWGTSAAFFDFNADGLLDLYVCHYAEWTWETNKFCGDRERKVRLYCSPRSVAPTADALYVNNGDGSFHDGTAAAGLTGAAGRSQGVVAADLDGDGAIDLYIGNDLHPNSLFLNRGDGQFRDATETSGVAYDYQGNSQAGMGVAAADTDGDGLFELLVTNFSNEHNAFYSNMGQGVFQDVSHRLGLAGDSLPWIGWGTTLTDFNLDGWCDLLVTNGHVDDNRSQLGQDTPHAQPPLLWSNRQGRFHFVGSEGGNYFRGSSVGRGLATGDLDGDNAVDVVIGHQDGRPALLRNLSKNPQRRS
ncbi:MAG: VCBS repeat-containing protein, partial [Planctomycetaceae bacterium]